ncbi:MAG TPA: hypothetical protein VHN11_21465 [Xanthobacteraceae bacterium]|nr:hypothetical protein [Xanthobacteraceae bacterium]
MEETSATLTKPQDAGKGQAGVVKRWLMALAISDKQEKDWRKTADEVVQRYRQEGEGYDTFAKSAGSKFNILWSNTEVQRPALYHSTPKPDVRRRYRDEDQAGKEAATTLERGLSFSVDAYDFDQVMNLAVLDLLLPGRAVTRVRYTPTFQTVTPPPELPAPISQDEETGAPVYAPEDLDEAGEPIPKKGESFEKITYQAVSCEHVAWKDFRRGPGRTWDEVEWIAFRHKLTMEQLEALCDDKADAKLVTLDCDDSEGDDKDNKDGDGEGANLFKRGEVWEVWDKTERQILFIAPSVKDKPLKKTRDELGLENFYPIPRPMYALESSDSLVPVELFKLYKDQADELDRVTQRINKLITACKIRGIYDSTMGAVAEAMKAGDNEFVPTSDGAIAMLAQGGSFDRAIWIFPVEKLAAVLKELYLSRDQIKATIYEITGLSDILRGESDADETLGAQQLKAQSGSRRLRRMQKEVQRYARDLMRLKAEIIAEHFEPFMLELMSAKTLTPDVMKVLRDDITRSYRIDIETDSTIAEDEQRDQESMAKLLDGITRYVAAVGPVVQAGYMPAQTAVTLLKSFARRVRLGREVEDALDDAQGQIEKQGVQEKPDPEMMKIQAEMQAQQQSAQMEMQLKQQEMAMKQQQAEAELQIKQQEAAMKLQMMQAEMAMKQRAFDNEQARLDQAAVAQADRARYETDAKVEVMRTSTQAQIEAQRAKDKAKPKEKRAA